MITENIVYRTNTEIKNPVYSEYGDVLIPASDTTPTGLARATSLEKSGVLLGGDINIIRPNEGINGSCLSLALNANRKELIRLIKGTTVRHIHNSEIKDIVICLPKLETEQVRVSSYFKQLDHLITLHQRKYFIIYNKLITWEQRKVSDLLQERNEQTPMSKEYPLMAFIANLGVAPKGERYDRSALVNDEAGKKYKKTEYGDFIYSSNNLEAGSIGLNKYGNACISPVYSIFKPIGKADLDFLGRRFLRKDFINEMVKWRQGVVYGQWKIHESDFLNIEIEVPSVDEQKAIGRYLDFLDHLITLHRRAL